MPSKFDNPADERPHRHALCARAPFNVRNLLHLARVYNGMKNSGRAAAMAREVLELEPDNEKAARLMESVKAGARGD